MTALHPSPQRKQGNTVGVTGWDADSLARASGLDGTRGLSRDMNLRAALQRVAQEQSTVYRNGLVGLTFSQESRAMRVVVTD